EKILIQLVEDTKHIGEAEGRPRMEGRTMHLIIGPKKKAVVSSKKAEAKPAPAPSDEGAAPPVAGDSSAPVEQVEESPETLETVQAPEATAEEERRGDSA